MPPPPIGGLPKNQYPKKGGARFVRTMNLDEGLISVKGVVRNDASHLLRALASRNRPKFVAAGVDVGTPE